jgi:hypothetical protein
MSLMSTPEVRWIIVAAEGGKGEVSEKLAQAISTAF